MIYFFVCLFVCLFYFLLVSFWVIYDEKLKFFSATSCDYDNVEVIEKSVMCHASYIIAGKDVGVFIFCFLHIQIFFWFNFRYVAKLFYLKIGKCNNSA